MKKIITLLATMILLSLIFVSGAAAQRGVMWKGGGGWGPGAPYGRTYDLQTIETVFGEVVAIDVISPMKGMSYGIHIILKTDKETIPVHLGPGWYIENQDVKIAPTDMIEVKGSRITFNGKPTLIAAIVKKGDQVLALRDASGFPAWSGWRNK